MEKESYLYALIHVDIAFGKNTLLAIRDTHEGCLHLAKHSYMLSDAQMAVQRVPRSRFTQLELEKKYISDEV